MAMTLLPNQVIIEQLKEDLEDLLVTDIDMWKEKYLNGDGSLKEQPLKQTPEAVFSDDPLALSVTSYLIWLKNPSRRWVPVSDVGHPTSEARELAQEIRKYYLQRNTMKVLMGQQPTDFQSKMNGFLADTRPLRIDEQGLLYRIPYFYQEDLALDRIFEGAADLDEDKPPVFSMTAWTTLTPIREVLRSRKNGDYIQFWFHNPSGERCVYDVKSDNKLLSVFRSVFKRSEIPVSCYSRMERLRGSHIKTKYWRLSNLELV